MKSLIKKLFSLAILLVLSVACSDEFIDRPPIDTIVSSNFYRTERDAQQALTAVYDVLQYQSVRSWAPLVTVSDMLSDDAFAGGGDSNDGANEDEFNKFNIPTVSDIARSIYDKNYIGIYRANLLLEKLDGIEASEAFKARVAAECKFLRAYFYFEQVRYFENIPLLTETIKRISDQIRPQNTPKEVYDQIALDLEEAIVDLPGTLPANELGRVTKWAAQSLLARVFLFYNGVYGADLQAGDITVNKARMVTHLDDVIANSGHDLMPDYADVFHLVGEYSEESVFEIGHGDSPAWWDWGYVQGGEGNLAAQLQGPRIESGSTKWNRGWSFAPVSEKLVQDMTGDPRISSTILFESELDGTLVKGYQHTGYYSKKYTSDAEHWGSDGQFELNRTCNFRVIRFSDVLLMAAELGSPNAQSYLDRVRARVGLASVPATLDNIYHERRMELSLEGLRYFDVIRRGMAYASQELTVVGQRGPKYTEDQVVYDVTFNPATKGFLPIPQAEIDLAGGVLEQNEGY